MRKDDPVRLHHMLDAAREAVFYLLMSLKSFI